MATSEAQACDRELYREVIGHFASGVTVITARHEWYEINYSGNQEQMRLDMLRFSGARGILEEADQLVERCMSEYDVDGWNDGIWFD